MGWKSYVWDSMGINGKGQDRDYFEGSHLPIGVEDGAILLKNRQKNPEVCLERMRSSIGIVEVPVGEANRHIRI